jgi:hypothetical protein
MLPFEIMAYYYSYPIGDKNNRRNHLVPFMLNQNSAVSGKKGKPDLLAFNDPKGVIYYIKCHENLQNIQDLRQRP